MMDFDTFLATAWRDHAEHSTDVGQRLAAAVDEHVADLRIEPFARLLTHVYGEHLGRWDHGIGLLARLRQASGPITSDETAIIERNIATLRYAADAAAPLDQLPVGDRVAALATASSALLGRGDLARAIAAFADALQQAPPNLPAAAPATRALAVGGNNLAAALGEQPQRSVAETSAMVGAAEAALEYWRLAGTWFEEERALHLIARSRLLAGDAGGAVAAAAAAACVDVCARNDAAPLERFFASAVQAIACRRAGDQLASEAAHAIALAQVPPDEQQGCAAMLAEIGTAP
jgi:hypothetical protein